jgi:hypothetical protein
VRSHLSKPEFLDDAGRIYPVNALMLDRLEAALAAGSPVRSGDLSFYLHELAEAELMAGGNVYQEEHEAAFAQFGVSRFTLPTERSQGAS